MDSTTRLINTMNTAIAAAEARSECSRLFCVHRRTEALFCLALLPEGTDAVERVTTRFIEYRDNMTPELLALIYGAQNAKDDAVNEVNPVNPLVETSFCHTHGEYSGPICPDCKSPLDMDIPDA